MEPVIEMLKTMDIGQVLVLGLMLWFFYSRLENKIEKMDVKLSLKIEKLDEKISDIDKRVFAIETMLHMKDCCMLKDERHIKKAE